VQRVHHLVQGCLLEFFRRWCFPSACDVDYLLSLSLGCVLVSLLEHVAHFSRREETVDEFEELFLLDIVVSEQEGHVVDHLPAGDQPDLLEVLKELFAVLVLVHHNLFACEVAAHVAGQLGAALFAGTSHSD